MKFIIENLEELNKARIFTPEENEQIQAINLKYGDITDEIYDLMDLISLLESAKITTEKIKKLHTNLINILQEKIDRRREKIPPN